MNEKVKQGQNNQSITISKTTTKPWSEMQDKCTSEDSPSLQTDTHSHHNKVENTEYNETLNIFDRITNSHTRTHTHTHTHNTHKHILSPITYKSQWSPKPVMHLYRTANKHTQIHTHTNTHIHSLSLIHTHTHITLHLNLSLNHGGRWGITDDFPTSFSLTNTQATATHDRTSTFTHQATR